MTAVVHHAFALLAQVARLTAVAAQAVADATRELPTHVPIEWVAACDLEDGL